MGTELRSVALCSQANGTQHESCDNVDLLRSKTKNDFLL